MSAVPLPRRIVVAIDSPAHARAAMEAATDLALRLRAEITAVFVEDIDLFRLAALPFAREIGSDAQTRPFDMPRLERRFRSEAREVRAVCMEAAERSRTQVRVEVARGAIAQEILAVAEEADMIMLGRARATARGRVAPREGDRSRRRSTPLGSTAMSVLATSTRTVAIVTPDRVIGRPVAVVYDGSEASRRALDLGVRLAGEDHHNLVVLLSGDEDRGDRLSAEVTAITRPHGIVPRCVAVTGAAGSIAEAVTAKDCRALVIDRNWERPEAGDLLALVERLDCPVFVVG